ncbi:uncharacterized protein LOC126816301 isoform X1 [Patella vulgata]|uniref:uncharacterized protein LOC126816301 isoform X1 n=1 Tax=Patella vulgata TaxID=6465 RepID=UPI00217F537C|nr:uncharacterized protein LOC126816301 isoform X1 [Patella vulgata]
MADIKATQFISALVKNLQAVCHGHVEFDENIKVVGHLFLTVDSGTEFNYILNEKVSKTDHSSITFKSRSFYATDPHPKPGVNQPGGNERPLKPPINDPRYWSNQYGAMDKKPQIISPHPALPMRDTHLSGHGGQIPQNRTVQKRSPQRNPSPQRFSKVQRLSEESSSKSIVKRPGTYDQNRITDYEQSRESCLSMPKSGKSASPLMGEDSGDERDYDSEIHYTEVQKKLIKQEKMKMTLENKIKSEPNSIKDPIASIKPKVSHSHLVINPPSSVSKPVAQPSSSTCTSKSSIDNQIIDVDLTKVKEEPQDEGYNNAEKAAAYAKVQDRGQHWQHGIGSQPQGQGDYGEEGYDEEGYEEGYEGDGYEEGYEVEGYEGDEYEGDEYFSTSQDGSIGLYPIGFAQRNEGQSSGQGGQMIKTSVNQQMMSNQMMQSGQMSQGPGRVGSTLTQVGKKQVNKIPCKYCRKEFTSEANLSRHIQSQHLQVRVKCPICHDTFARKETLKKHMLKKHTDDGNLMGSAWVACPICEEEFSNKDLVNKHVFELHRVNPPFP